MNGTPTLTAVIRNKDKVIFSGQVYAITTINDKGPFDVLAEHENFISLIKDKVTIRNTPKEKTEIKIRDGILRVYRDKVYIYVNVTA